ncbi:TENS4 protein, partial [Rhinopomastus cyanomelas]|nr:TENS4 protein [Rhinopomastus cyanomelas]
LVSPTLDISIESLNRLILEIDPTFQPLACPPAPRGHGGAATRWDPAAVDIKCIQVAPGRAAGPQELLQGPPSPSLPASSRPPQGNGLLPHTGGLRGSPSPGGSVAFSGSPGPASPGSGSPRGFERSPVLQRSPAGALGSISHSPPALGTSSQLLKPVQVVRAQQRSSSLLSSSPGSDTSYILGSSTQSLHTEDSPSRPAECPSPGSPPGSPCSRSHSGEASGRSPQQPLATSSSRASSSPSQKGQASSCPPSIVSSPGSDIPLLLVNGCPEQGGASCSPARAPPASARQDPPPGCSQTPRLGALSAAQSAPVLSCTPDGALGAGGQPTMKFVMDTSKYWFKPSISREQATRLLQDSQPGTFVVRDSTSQRGSFGLAMVVPGSAAGNHTGDQGSERVRHFLIESSARGVRLRGAGEQLCFGSLSAFVHQHSIAPLALPCRLRIPARDLADGEEGPDCSAEPPRSLPKRTAVCNLLYLSSVTVETLTGPPAVQKAVSSTLEREALPIPTLVHFRVTEQGVTLTDIQRRVFFRRHYPLATVRFCGMDPENRRWQKFCKSSRIFGLVAKSREEAENLCHLFAEYDAVQPASLVLDVLRSLLPGP